MKKKNFWKRFAEWQNYTHYLLLTIALVIFFHLNEIHTFHTKAFLPNLNFLYLLIFVIIMDTLVHGIFWILPKKLRWRD